MEITTRHPSATIQRAENGYLVTFQPGRSVEMDMGFPTPPQAMTDLRLEEIKCEIERSRPRVLVYIEITDAQRAINEFLMDGRMPS